MRAEMHFEEKCNCHSIGDYPRTAEMRICVRFWQIKFCRKMREKCRNWEENVRNLFSIDWKLFVDQRPCRLMLLQLPHFNICTHHYLPPTTTHCNVHPPLPTTTHWNVHPPLPTTTHYPTTTQCNVRRAMRCTLQCTLPHSEVYKVYQCSAQCGVAQCSLVLNTV